MRKSRSETFRSISLTSGVVLLFSAWMIRFSTNWLTDWAEQWPSLLFWIGMVIVIDLFPIRVGSLLLTLEVPVLLAVALLHSPEVAASVACLGALDMREVKGGVGFGKALFNRVQIALSVLAAGHVLHLFEPDVGRIGSLMLPALIALLVDYSLNAGMVVAMRLADGSAPSFRRELSALRVGSWAEFLGTYLAYGLLALLFARLYIDAGAWAVALLLVAALVARQSLVRSRQLERLGKDLSVHQQLLMRALERVVEERRDERLLIGGQLHDEVLQSIVRARLGIATLRRELESPSLHLEEVERATLEADAGLRQVIRGLRESPLGPQGLASAVRTLARELRLEWGVEIQLDVQVGRGLPAPHQVALYQVTREAVMNALRHASCSVIRVTLRYRDGLAELEISDDGVGFSTLESEESNHFGLALMRERIDALGGSFDLSSEKGRGTKVSVTLPVEGCEEPSPRVNAS